MGSQVEVVRDEAKMAKLGDDEGGGRGDYGTDDWRAGRECQHQFVGRT